MMLGRADIVIAGHVLPLGTVACALKRWRGTPFILMTYGEDVTMCAHGRRMSAMLVSAICGADAVTCLTRESADEIALIVGGGPAAQGRIEVWPPPADAGIADTPEEAVARITAIHHLKGRRVVLTVARLTPRKGIDVTMKAVAMLRDEFPGLAYLIVGDGPDEARLRALAAELGITEMTIFAGPTHYPAPFYHACEVFVMPNRQLDDGEREGYGIVFPEAGLAGKPVIGGRSGGATDAIADGETGLLADPKNPATVAAAMRTLLSDTELAKRLGMAGRERAMRLSSPQAAQERLEKLMRKILICS
ncbi:MAG: glycosyltransferase family 4 protein [Candidatus Sumerlaeota bacterium]|nr:glycosyltransferase family 4 protein [Candidatus Sumerlaeota bacterium]